MIPEVITGPGRLSLTPLLPEHVGTEYVLWLNDTELQRYTEVTGEHTPETTREYVSKSNSSENSAMWKINVAEEQHIGNIRLSNINYRHKRAEIALLIGNRNWWGKGIATEAIGLISEYAFSTLGIEKLSAGMIAPNMGSFRAFRKAGFQHESTLQKHAVLGHERENVFLVCKFANQTGSE
jgi:[ribosomal protein S5]-alanine N-acetyltransferase